MGSVTSAGSLRSMDQQYAFPTGGPTCLRIAGVANQKLISPTPKQWARVGGGSRCLLLSEPPRPRAGRREVGRPCFAIRRR